MSSPDLFLTQLKQEAKKQAVLHEKRLLPRQVDWLTSYIGTYPWQTLLVSSGIVAVLLQMAR